jgi:hypothetical protein
MMVFVSCAALFGFGFAQSTSVAQLYLRNFGLFFFNEGAWGVWDTWMGELYPTDVRGVGYAWASLCNAWRMRWRRSPSARYSQGIRAFRLLFPASLRFSYAP